jgi:hypothetical protein
MEMIKINNKKNAYGWIEIRENDDIGTRYPWMMK